MTRTTRSAKRPRTVSEKTATHTRRRRDTTNGNGALRSRVEKYIDKYLSSVGVNAAAVTDEEGFRHIRLGCGGCVGIIEIEDDVLLRVEANVMKLPSDRELLLPLMRELLKINYALSGPGRLAIDDDDVHAIVMLRADGIGDAGVVAWAINTAMQLADQVDKRLSDKYERTARKRAKAWSS